MVWFRRCLKLFQAGSGDAGKKIIRPNGVIIIKCKALLVGGRSEEYLRREGNGEHCSAVAARKSCWILGLGTVQLQLLCGR